MNLPLAHDDTVLERIKLMLKKDRQNIPALKRQVQFQRLVSVVGQLSTHLLNVELHQDWESAHGETMQEELCSIALLAIRMATERRGQ